MAALSAGTFFAIALVMWFKKPELDPLPVSAARSSLKIAAAAFAGIFFSEWGDMGQLAAATLAARYRLPSVVWAGAVLAMMTKGILAITLGTNLRSRVPRGITLRDVWPLPRHGNIGRVPDRSIREINVKDHLNVLVPVAGVAVHKLAMNCKISAMSLNAICAWITRRNLSVTA